MKKTITRSAWIILPLVIWLVLVVRATPAQWGIALAGLPLQMDGISGTIWRGQVANVVVPHAGGHYSLGRLQWELNPWSLLRLSPCATFATELDNQTTAGTACTGLSRRLVLRDTRVSVPAGVAELWAPVQVRGQVDAHIESLVLVGEQIRNLKGSGSWTNAQYHNSQAWVNLGTIAFDFNENGEGGVAAKVFDIEGPLELDLNSSFDLAGAYVIRGNIGLRPNAPQEIGQLLMIVGQERQRGQFAIEWIGS